MKLFSATWLRPTLDVGLRGYRIRSGGINPGIQNRLRILASEDSEFSDSAERIEDLEADFMAVNKEYDAHQRELHQDKDRRQLKIVERKYFKKPREPNLLTWEEQEHIRYLHESDPEGWSVEKLAASFPATESIIQSVLKTEWKPSEPERIKKYNESVLNNWKLYRKGLLVMSEELKKHISHFTPRRSISLPAQQMGLTEKQHSQITAGSSEFGDIIESYKALKSSQNNEQILKLPHSKTAYVPADSSIRNNCRRIETADSVSTVNHKYQDTAVSWKKDDQLSSRTEENALLLKANLKHSSDIKSSMQITEGEIKQLPEKIRVPQKYRGTGKLFRVDDCFYDQDGEFLYRVPGMKS